MFCCSTVCGLWPSQLGKGHLLHFFSKCFASHPLPTACLDPGWGLLSFATKPCYHRQAPFACSFISSVSDYVGVSGAGVPLLSLTPLSLSLSRLPTHRLSADVAWGHSGPWPSGPRVCVCATFAPSNPVAMRYRWDLRLSVSANAARRRRKQDARGSTVISQRALFHTIPGRSLYSLHAGLPLDIYMCQQSHCYWPT